MPKPNLRTKQKVVKALTRYGKRMPESWARSTNIPRRMRGYDANSFVLGVLLDRNVNAQRAWDAGEWITESIGADEDVCTLWRNLRSMSARRLEGFMRYGWGGRAFHRHWKRMSKAFKACAELMLEKYEGDPRKIWNGQREVAQVRERLEEVQGIGPALSRMAVLILARNYGLLGGKRALAELDIKPDIHVMRVFKRTGLLPKDASTTDAILAARNFWPNFPAALDAPAWKIGSQFCRPRSPRCHSCPITKACPRIV